MVDVVAAIIKKKNKFLIAKRNKYKYFSLKWEFPGGKVKKNENLEDALHREIMEELNINISINKKIHLENFKDDNINIKLHYYICSHISGCIKLNEHEEFMWALKKNFTKFNFVAGDKTVFPFL